jgi:phospholipid transport system substrate-binding protein
MHTKPRWRFLVVLGALLALALPGAAEGDAPRVRIEGLHEALLGVMQNAETLGYEGRAKRLTPVIPEYFDIEFMAQKSVGRHWKKATEADRQRFLDTFRRFMVANYAGQFDGFSGQRFVTRGEEPAPPGRSSTCTSTAR